MRRTLGRLFGGRLFIGCVFFSHALSLEYQSRPFAIGSGVRSMRSLQVRLWPAFLALCPRKSLMEPFPTVAELARVFEVHQTAKVRSS